MQGNLLELALLDIWEGLAGLTGVTEEPRDESPAAVGATWEGKAESAKMSIWLATTTGIPISMFTTYSHVQRIVIQAQAACIHYCALHDLHELTPLLSI